MLLVWVNLSLNPRIFSIFWRSFFGQWGSPTRYEGYKRSLLRDVGLLLFSCSRDALLQKRLAGLCLFWCYQPSCVVSQQSWFWAFLFHKFSNFTPPPPATKNISQAEIAASGHEDSIVDGVVRDNFDLVVKACAHRDSKVGHTGILRWQATCNSSVYQLWLHFNPIKKSKFSLNPREIIFHRSFFYDRSEVLLPTHAFNMPVLLPVFTAIGPVGGYSAHLHRSSWRHALPSQCERQVLISSDTRDSVGVNFAYELWDIVKVNFVFHSISPRHPQSLPHPVRWSDAVLQTRLAWLCLFCCYQPCAVSQQSRFGLFLFLFLFHPFSNFTLPPPSVRGAGRMLVIRSRPVRAPSRHQHHRSSSQESCGHSMGNNNRPRAVNFLRIGCQNLKVQWLKLRSHHNMTHLNYLCGVQVILVRASIGTFFSALCYLGRTFSTTSCPLSWTVCTSGRRTPSQSRQVREAVFE